MFDTTFWRISSKWRYLTLTRPVNIEECLFLFSENKIKPWIFFYYYVYNLQFKSELIENYLASTSLKLPLRKENAMPITGANTNLAHNISCHTLFITELASPSPVCIYLQTVLSWHLFVQACVTHILCTRALNKQPICNADPQVLSLSLLVQCLCHILPNAQCIHPIRNDFLLYRKLTNQSARFGHTPDIPTFFTAVF